MKSTKKATLKQDKELKLLDMPGPPAPLFKSITRVKTAMDARRLLSRVIAEYQRRTINGTDSKCLAYLVSVFLQSCSLADIEERIQVLEEK